MENTFGHLKARWRRLMKRNMSSITFLMWLLQHAFSICVRFTDSNSMMHGCRAQWSMAAVHLSLLLWPLEMVAVRARKKSVIHLCITLNQINGYNYTLYKYTAFIILLCHKENFVICCIIIIIVITIAFPPAINCE